MGKKDRLIRHSLFCCAMLLPTAWASAQLEYNFDDGVNPFGVGTVSSDQSVSASNSLYLGGDQFVDLVLPGEYVGQALSISFQIFDEGRWTTSTDMGPRWGVGAGTDGGQFVAASLITRGGVVANQGYGRNGADPFLGQFSGNTWWGPFWFDYQDGRADGSGTMLPFMSANGDGSAGTGIWYEWTFETDGTGLVTWTRTGSPTTYTDENVGGPVDRILLWGGDTGDAMTGIYVDDIVVNINGPTVLLGDANNDGVVSADDFAAVQTNFGNTGAADGLLPGDANDDGVVSADDFAAIQTNFGNVLGAAAEADPIPEPATIGLLTVAALGILRRRRA